MSERDPIFVENERLRAENERLKHVLAMTKYREEQWEERFPCNGGCTPQYGPEETCSRDGRKPDDLWRIISEQSQQLAAVRAVFAGGPDTSCRTTWSEGIECVEVPMADLHAALGD